MNSLSCALIQSAAVSYDPKINMARIADRISAAAQDGAQLVVLSELHNHRYFCQQQNIDNFDLAETMPGCTTEWLNYLSAKFKIVIVGSIFERKSNGVYFNTAVVSQDGQLVGIYRKMHIPDDPGFNEKFYFSPGDLGFRPIDTRLGSLGVLICWDQWFPESARLMALAGADLLIFPTAVGWVIDEPEDDKARQLDSWIIIHRAHAVANGIPVISCNRTGREIMDGSNTSGIDFWGNSLVTGPQGELLGIAASDSEQILMVDIDLGRSETVRRIWPFMRDRRIDAYDNLLKRSSGA